MPSCCRSAIGRGGFTDQDFLDLQVWHKLAWVDPFYLDDDARVRRLVQKQRSFSEGRQGGAARRRARDSARGHPGVPRGRRARAGRAVDLAVLSPDPAAAVRHRHLSEDASGFGRAAARFRRPEDAPSSSRGRGSVISALFGTSRPVLWPSEGSVSDEMVELAAAAGFKWMATDEAILGRTIGREFRRDAARPGRAARAAVPAVLGAGRVRVRSRCLFRDHALSDLIGFVYAGWQAEEAAADFVDRLAEAGRRFSAASGGEEATIPDHPRRRERLGALRGRRPPVPARAVRQARHASRAADRDDERGGRACHAGP